MKRLLAVSLFSMLLASASFGQFPDTIQNRLQGSIGPTWIDNQPFYAIRLRPDFSLGKIGVGLDLGLEFDAHGSLRTENFNEFSDYVSVIRYLRYGTETDTLFVKLGMLDYVTLGQGNIVNVYNNSPSYDARRTGMQLNLNFDKYGIQTLWSNFAQAGVVGARAFVKPLRFNDATDLPIISNIEVGATWASDFSQYANSRYSVAAGSTTGVPFVEAANALTVTGLDFDFPVLRSGITGIDLYANYTKFISYGSGSAAGAMFHFDLSALLSARAKLERRFNGDRYIAGYFDALYELERVNAVTGFAKSDLLSKAVGGSNGYYGDLLINVLSLFDVVGSYQKLDDVPNSGIFHAATDIAPKDAPVIARAGYDKVNIVDFSDLVTTDDRSYLFGELGYKPTDYLIASLRYSWTFTPVRNGSDIVGFEPQRKLEPKITFVYQY